MRYEINLDNVTTKMQFHEKIRETIPCPEYYGGNLDALYDVLTDRLEPLEIKLEYANELKEILCGYGEAFIETLQDAAASCNNISLEII